MPGPGVTATLITIGMTNDLSGAGDTPYAAVTEAMGAYIRKVNEEDDGVCGRTLRLFAADDGYQPQLALEKTKAMIESGQVLAIAGSLNTDAHQQVAAYLNDPNADGNTSDGVPDLFVSTGWSGWGDYQRYPWTIGYIPDYWSDGAVLGRYIAANMPDKKVGVIYRDDVFGRDYFAGVTAAMPGVQVSQQPFPVDGTSADDQLVRLNTEGVQVVVVAAPPEVTANIVKSAAAGNYKPTWALSYTNAPSQLASLIGGGTTAEQLLAGFQAMEGTVTTQYLLSPVEDEADPAMIEHARIMQSYQGPPMISSLSVYGQSLAELLIEALNGSCHNLTRDGLLEAAESITDFRSSLMLPGISVDLSPTDHRSVQTLQPVIVRADGAVEHTAEVVSVDDLPLPTLAPTPLAPVTPTPTTAG